MVSQVQAVSQQQLTEEQILNLLGYSSRIMLLEKKV